METLRGGGEAAEAPRARDSKLLWALGNYSRFVRPGAVRYDVRGLEDPYSLMVSAYRNSDGHWVVVALNYADEIKNFELSINDGHTRRWQAYRTSDVEGENLKPLGVNDGSVRLSSRSITTFVEQ